MNAVHAMCMHFQEKEGANTWCISLALLTAQLESAQMIMRISREQTDRKVIKSIREIPTDCSRLQIRQTQSMSYREFKAMLTITLSESGHIHKEKVECIGQYFMNFGGYICTQKIGLQNSNTMHLWFLIAWIL